jgi:uncharacterized protein DUF2313
VSVSPGAYPPLPAEGVYTEIEAKFIAESPDGLWPENQNSNFGLFRKIICDPLQEVLDELDMLYNERFPDTSINFLDRWEDLVGLPINPPNKPLEERRNLVLSRLIRGRFTRTQRIKLIAGFITVTFGPPILFTPDGIPIPPEGIPFFSGVAGEPEDFFTISENVENFHYTVVVDPSVDIDVEGVTRALTRSTPAGISFNIQAGFLIVNLTVSGGEITDINRVAGTYDDGTTIDSSYGMWEQTTNLIRNSALLTNLNDWSGV